MDEASLASAVRKLSSFGERAGLSKEQMIRILEAGFTVEDLVRLIDLRLLAERERERERDN